MPPQHQLSLLSLILFLAISATHNINYLYSLSHFFLQFRQHHCRNSLSFLIFQITLNSTNITNKLNFLQYSAKRLSFVSCNQLLLKIWVNMYFYSNLFFLLPKQNIQNKGKQDQNVFMKCFSISNFIMAQEPSPLSCRIFYVNWILKWIIMKIKRSHCFGETEICEQNEFW